MKESEENEIMRKAYEEYADVLFRYCFFKLSNREEALDAVQEVFTRTWAYFRGGQEIRNIRSFLFRVARNLIIDFYRREKVYTLSALEEREADPPQSPDDAVRNAEVSVVRAALGKLPEHYREVLTLRYFSGFSPREIAELLDESENAVSVRLHRALARLRTILHIDDEK